MKFGVGVIEGFYGEPWPDGEREAAFGFLCQHGYGSYLYAPKADRWLRDGWRDEPPPDWGQRLERMAAACRDARLHFGVGLSPVGADGEAADVRRRVAVRARWLATFGLDMLAVLFDDMPAPVDEAARVQADLVRAAADASGISRVLACPTWYSDDPLLARDGMHRPAGYLEALGQALDANIGVFWTGPSVCTARYSSAHLDDVTRRLGRPPVLWDNYPVNDGPRMCQHLHLAAFSGRGPEVAERVDGIFANPMNQCALSRVPLTTLPWNLWQPRYDARQATLRAMQATLPRPLALLLTRDAARFQEQGRAALAHDERLALAREYLAHEHPAAREVAAWLEGRYEVDAKQSGQA